MIREESFKGVPKLAQKDQETEKCIFSVQQDIQYSN